VEEKKYSAAEMERILKIQEVIAKAIAGKLTWWEAAEIMGVTDRTMRRWRGRIEKNGYSSLYDRRKHPSPKRVPLDQAQRVLSLYQEKYSDFNVRHFHEKLVGEHQIDLSYSWVKKALQLAGFVKVNKRGKHRRRRPRRPIPGMMLHIDASKHQWMGEQWHDLIVILDDATSEIYYAQLVEEESTRTVMAGLRVVVEKKGWFSSIYSDRASHFFKTPKAGQPLDTRDVTQVGRAMRDLGIRMIPAYSPQARGRSERSFRTWQGRLPQELRVRGIRTEEQANNFLQNTYMAEFNDKFTSCKRRRNGLHALASARSGSHLCCPAGAKRQQRQYDSICESHLAIAANAIAGNAVRLLGAGLPTSGRNLHGRLRSPHAGSIHRLWGTDRNRAATAAAGFRKSIAFHCAPLRPSGFAGAPFQPTLFRKPKKETKETIQLRTLTLNPMTKNLTNRTNHVL